MTCFIKCWENYFNSSNRISILMMVQWFETGCLIKISNCILTICLKILINLLSIISFLNLLEFIEEISSDINQQLGKGEGYSKLKSSWMKGVWSVVSFTWSLYFKVISSWYSLTKFECTWAVKSSPDLSTFISSFYDEISCIWESFMIWFSIVMGSGSR